MSKASCLVVVVLLLALSAPAQTAPARTHIVVVALENHSYSQVVGNPSMPYLNGLINQFGLATAFYANTHESLPNYFDVLCGELVTLDNSFNAPVSINNLERQLINAGKTWKAMRKAFPRSVTPAAIGTHT